VKTPTGLPIDMVATDLDGTFLATGGQPTAFNVRAVLRASQLGVRVVFATGRPSRWLQPLDAVRSAHPYAIASNGAVVVNLETGAVVEAHPLPVDVTADVAAQVGARVPGAGFAVEYTGGGWGRTPAYPVRGDMVAQDVLSGGAADLLHRGTAVKLLIYGPGVPTEALVRLVAPLVGDRLELTYSMVRPDGLLELCAPGVNKASALRHLMAQDGIEPARLAAFGDMPNDLPMLRLAGYGFAMANAHPSLLDQGFRIAGDHDDSGFAHALLALLGEPAAS